MANPPGPDSAPIRSDEEVLTRVDQIVDRESRMLPSLWLFFLDKDGRQLPVLVPVDGIPDEPQPDEVAKLGWVIGQVLGESEPDGSVVITLTRPGPPVPDTADLSWHDALHAATSERGVRIRMMCLATPDGVAPLTASLR